MDEIKITRRHLPHWTVDNAVYFVTFNSRNTEFNRTEQITILEHIKKGNNKYYTLHATIVMPDHVHMIFEPLPKYTLRRIMKGTKGASANLINKLRGANGQIWQDESFDRIIRDEKEYHEKVVYMYNNPLKKGLTEDPENYHGWYINDNLG